MIKPVIGKGPKAIEHAIAHAQKDPGGVLGPWSVFHHSSLPNRFQCSLPIFSAQVDGYHWAHFHVGTTCIVSGLIRLVALTRNGVPPSQGIFAIQVWRYFATFGYESKGIFTLVVACIVLSMLVKAAFAFNGRATNGLKQTFAWHRAQWVVVELVAWDWFVAQ